MILGVDISTSKIGIAVIDSNKKILDNVANIAWVGLPLDTLDSWTNQVRQVTADQVKQAFLKYIDMQAMVTVIVGADER